MGNCCLAFIEELCYSEGRVLTIGSKGSEYYNGSIQFDCNVNFTGTVSGITSGITSAVAVFG